MGRPIILEELLECACTLEVPPEKKSRESINKRLNILPRRLSYHCKVLGYFSYIGFILFSSKSTPFLRLEFLVWLGV